MEKTVFVNLFDGGAKAELGQIFGLFGGLRNEMLQQSTLDMFHHQDLFSAQPLKDIRYVDPLKILEIVSHHPHVPGLPSEVEFSKQGFTAFPDQAREIINFEFLEFLVQVIGHGF